MHAVHGCVIFKMADDAGFFAANSVVPDVFVLTANFSIHFLKPIATGYLVAKGTVIHKGNRQIITDSICYDESEHVVARGRGVYMPSRVSLIDSFKELNSNN